MFHELKKYMLEYKIWKHLGVVWENINNERGRRDLVIRQFLTISLGLLLPLIGLFLLFSFLFNEAIDWEYIYVMAVFILISAMILVSVQDIGQRVNNRTKYNYTASVRSGPIIILTTIMVINTSVTFNGLEVETLVLRIALLAAIILLSFLRFKFYIEDKTLTYEILFYSIVIYKRIINPDEIKRVQFVRSGWSNKGAIIKVKKGFNIRIINFEPVHVCAELNIFADKHSIPVVKTYDYMLLEKSSRRPA